MAEPIKVLIADDMSKKAVEVLSKAGFTVEVKTGMKPEELAAVLSFLVSDDAALISGAAIPVYGRV